MRLADFILSGMENILVQWEAFARTLYPAKAGMTTDGLRDHARQILEAIAADLRTGQTAENQERKSKGLVFPPPDAPETAAQTHAVLRAQSGMDINQWYSPEKVDCAGAVVSGVSSGSGFGSESDV